MIACYLLAFQTSTGLLIKQFYGNAFCLHSCNAEQIHCYTVSLLWVEMFSLSRYYGTYHLNVNCCRNVDIIDSHMQNHQGNTICHIAPSLRLLVPSSNQVQRQSVQVYHHHSRPGVPLN
jgi:hypothetical protein